MAAHSIMLDTVGRVTDHFQQRARDGLRDVVSDAANVAEAARSIQSHIFPLLDVIREHPLFNNGHFVRLRRSIRVIEDDAPLHIPGSVLIYWNPVANRNKAERTKDRLITRLRETGLLEERRDDGAIVFSWGDARQIVFRSTLEDPIERHRDMVREIESLLKRDPHQRIAVVGIGGDRTADDIAAAVRSVRRSEVDGWVPHLVAVAAKGGTANDLCGITGVPDGVEAFLRFLGDSSAVETELLGLRFTLDSLLPGSGRYESNYGSTWGESGELFARLEQVKTERKKMGGSVSVLDYILLLPKTVIDTTAIYVKAEIRHDDGTITRINDGKPVASGEIFGPLATHQLGGITKLCNFGNTVKLTLTPTVPQAVFPLLEAVARNLLVLMGMQTFATRKNGVYTMSTWRQILLKRGDRVKMEFFEDEEATRPMQVRGTLAGDVVGPDTVVRAEVIEPTPFLSHPHCDLRVQLGLAKPRLPGDRLTNNVVSRTVGFIRRVILAR